MAELGMDFDANSVEPNAPIDVLPAGKYVVQIVQSELRNAKSGGGKYLWLEMDIVEGQFEGRKLWDQLNIFHDSQQAQDIARRTLSAICHATGQMNVSDSDKLHGKSIVATVKVRPAGADNQGVQREAQNEVRGYAPVEGGAARPVQTTRPAQTQARPAQQPTTTAHAGATAGKAPPWRRGAAA